MTIIVLSQPGNVAHSLYDMTVELLSIMEENKVDYHLIYKLHPTEFLHKDAVWQKFAPKFDGKVEIIDSSEKSLYYYFSLSDIQVAVRSTAILEGLSFKLKTFIYDSVVDAEYDYIEYMYKTGYAQPFRDARELFEKMTDEKSVRPPDKNPFFMDDAAENIVREIRKYL
jgi:hypothetical protein